MMLPETVQPPEEFVQTADWTDWQSTSAVLVVARVRGWVPPEEPYELLQLPLQDEPTDPLAACVTEE
jgi:hypothetical protein